MATESKEVETTIEPLTIDQVDALSRYSRLNDPIALDYKSILIAVDNALSVSARKGFDTFGGLSHKLYRENVQRRIGVDSIFWLVCSVYADALIQEIPVHLLAAHDGGVMYECEKKGSLIEYYNTYKMPPRPAPIATASAAASQ